MGNVFSKHCSMIPNEMHNIVLSNGFDLMLNKKNLE